MYDCRFGSGGNDRFAGESYPPPTLTVVHAEESQSTIDGILRQMYALYLNGDWDSMYAIATSDLVDDYVQQISVSGSDRYICDIDGNTKAMLCAFSDGSGYWYFGQMEGSLRQGYGTAISVGSSNHQTFTGNYNGDFPSGEGKLSIAFNSGTTFDISGNFQGTYLNGTYQVDASWWDEGDLLSSSLPTTYANNHLQSVGGWEIDSYTVDWDEENRNYVFYIDSLDEYSSGVDVYFTVGIESEIFAVGLSSETGDEEWNDWVGSGTYWSNWSSSLDEGLFIFRGNAAPAPAPAITTPDIAAPTLQPAVTPVTPGIPAVTPDTYVVERGDNLSKIAKKVYGDSKYWKNIYEANSDVIKSDYTIWANQVLVIPAL